VGVARRVSSPHTPPFPTPAGAICAAVVRYPYTSWQHEGTDLELDQFWMKSRAAHPAPATFVVAGGER